MAFPGMRERCVKIGSAGKMFALTGWKIGFLMAAPPLTQVLAKAHQFLTFTTPPNLQAAVAWGLENSEAWFEAMPGELAASRDLLAGALRREGFAPLPAEGTYFLNVDLAASGVVENDMDFAMRAVKEAGVAAIPNSAFYETDPVTTTIRLCFAKRGQTLEEGARRLAKARDLSLEGCRGNLSSGTPRRWFSSCCRRRQRGSDRSPTRPRGRRGTPPRRRYRPVRRDG